jgi:hypothetical protein
MAFDTGVQKFPHSTRIYVYVVAHLFSNGGSVVVKALGYKPEGRGFDFR